MKLQYIFGNDEAMNEEKYTVLLSVMGKNKGMDDGEDMDTVKLMTTGELHKIPDGWQLDYTESDPESGDNQYIVLTMTHKGVTMQRRGAYGTTMVFEKDRRFEGFYRTPYGDLRMGVFATRVGWKAEKGQGHVELQYQLDVQGHFSAVHELTLRFACHG